MAIAILLSLSSRCLAQYFPQPARVDEKEETALRGIILQSKDDQLYNAVANLSALYYSKPIKNISDLDSALRYARLAKEMTSQKQLRRYRDEANFLLGVVLMAKNQHEEAEKLLPEMSDTARERLMLSLSYKYLFRLEKGTNETNQSTGRDYAQKAKLIAASHHQQLNGLQADIYLAEFDGLRSKHAAAKEQLLSVLNRYRQLGYDSLQYVYFFLYDVSSNMDEDSASFQYITKAIESARSTKDSTGLGDFLVLLGMLYQHQDKKEVALSYYQTAGEIYQRYSGLIGIYIATFRITSTLIDLHRYQEALNHVQAAFKKHPPVSDYDFQYYFRTVGDCYLKLKQYDRAEEYFQKGFNYDITHNISSEQTYHRMAFFYVESHQYAKAIPYLSRADTLSPQTDIRTQAHLQYMYYLADSALGRYKTAMHHLAQNRNMNDTMHSVANRQALQKLTELYETEKKNQEISALIQKQKLQDSELHGARLTQRFTIAGITILLILTGLAFNQYLQKRKNAALMAKKNLQLENLLTEKEWLIREIHHRVKNNLHTIICLLQIQAEFLKDDALNAISNSQNRIFAMSLIHQKLYLAEERHEIDMAVYIPELIQYLRESFGSPDNITFQMDVEKVLVNVSIAVTLGLIINEAVSNSIKYAFAGKTSRCVIGIGAHCMGEVVTLHIMDNGIGFDPDSSSLKQGSLGLKLIRGLCGDIRADYTISGDNGTQIVLKFVPSALSDL